MRAPCPTAAPGGSRAALCHQTREKGVVTRKRGDVGSVSEVMDAHVHCPDVLMVLGTP